MVFMPHWPKMLGSKPIDLGLDRIIKLMDRLGNPQESLPNVIHVAGTNGKGSTIAFMRSILKSAGYKVHSYTSPHLQNFNERIKINDIDISDEYLTEIMEECKKAAGDDIPVTFFEGTTAGAFLAFSRNPADVVLLETGLGGRLDATNIINKPALTVITPVSIDHTEYLGPTIDTITREKAGIIKENVPCVISMQYPEAMDILLSKAEEKKAKSYAFEYDWLAIPNEEGFCYKHQGMDDLMLPLPSLPGEHQIVNAATAISALNLLPDIKITEQNIKDGLTKAKWPGRLQKINHGELVNSLPQGWELWLDGAHNPSSAQSLSKQMEKWQDKPLYAICGITRGRDPKSLFEFFVPYLTAMVATNVETEPSALDPKVIADAANALNIKATTEDSLIESIDYIVGHSKEPARIIICGSLYLVSDALNA